MDVLRAVRHQPLLTSLTAAAAAALDLCTLFTSDHSKNSSMAEELQHPCSVFILVLWPYIINIQTIKVFQNKVSNSNDIK